MSPGDHGWQIVVSSGGYDMNGAVATLIIAPGTADNYGQGKTTGSLAIASDGLSATYTVQASDFGAAGFWQIWLRISDEQGAELLTSPPGQIYLNPIPALAA